MEQIQVIDLTRSEREHLEAAGIACDADFYAERVKHVRYAKVDKVPLERVCPVCHRIELRLIDSPKLQQ